jgi:uncharacterized protein (TIGR02246 family)
MMRSHSVVLLPIVIVTMTLSSGCWRQRAEHRLAEREHLMQERMAAAQQAIRTASADWAKAAQAKDLEKSLSYYTPNAILFAPKAPAIQGIENIRKAWQPMLATPGLQMSFTPTSVEVSRSADFGWEYGTYQTSATDKKGKTATETGKYIVLWQKQADGSWKAIADLSAADK